MDWLFQLYFRFLLCVFVQQSTRLWFILWLGILKWRLFPPLGSNMGFHRECPGPVHLPVSGRHWWKTGQEDKQQLTSGGAFRPRLWCRLHRCVTSHCTTEPKLLFSVFCTNGSGKVLSFHFVVLCSVFLLSFSLCCCGNMHFMWNRKIR